MTVIDDELLTLNILYPLTLSPSLFLLSPMFQSFFTLFCILIFTPFSLFSPLFSPLFYYPSPSHSSGDNPLYRCLVEDRQVGSYSYNQSHSHGGLGSGIGLGGTGGGGGGGGDGLYDHVESTIPKDTHFQSGSWTRKVSNENEELRKE